MKLSIIAAVGHLKDSGNFAACLSSSILNVVVMSSTQQSQTPKSHLCIHSISVYVQFKCVHCVWGPLAEHHQLQINPINLAQIKWTHLYEMRTWFRHVECVNSFICLFVLFSSFYSSVIYTDYCVDLCRQPYSVLHKIRIYGTASEVRRVCVCLDVNLVKFTCAFLWFSREKKPNQPTDRPFNLKSHTLSPLRQSVPHHTIDNDDSNYSMNAPEN